MERYTPTRLEWAAVQFNARVTGTLGHRTNVRVYCTHPKPPSTIVCSIFRAPDATQETATRVAQIVGDLFAQYEQERGFPWLELELSEPPPMGALLE